MGAKPGEVPPEFDGHRGRRRQEHHWHMATITVFSLNTSCSTGNLQIASAFHKHIGTVIWTACPRGDRDHEAECGPTGCRRLGLGVLQKITNKVNLRKDAAAGASRHRTAAHAADRPRKDGRRIPTRPRVGRCSIRRSETGRAGDGSIIDQSAAKRSPDHAERHEGGQRDRDRPQPESICKRRRSRPGRFGQRAVKPPSSGVVRRTSSPEIPEPAVLDGAMIRESEHTRSSTTETAYIELAASNVRSPTRRGIPATRRATPGTVLQRQERLHGAPAGSSGSGRRVLRFAETTRSSSS